MKSVSQLKSEFSSVKSKKGSRIEKIPLVRNIRVQIGEIEKEAARDFGFPRVEIRKVQDFIAEVDSYLRP